MKQIKLLGQTVNVLFVHTTNKHTYLVFKDGYIEVRLSRFEREKIALKYIESHEKLILRKLQTQEKVFKHKKQMTQLIFGQPLTKQQASLKRTLSAEKWRQHLRFLLEVELNNLLEKYRKNDLVDITGVVITIRNMKTRYGSCQSVKRKITINEILVHYDKKIIEYVFLHEIAHLVEPNHSKKFYQLLTQLCPNHKALKRKLNSLKE
jgi:predicted metal-dependent hydrolase